ncbi:MAG: ribose-phosphate pyrophosphokinase, partial [Eubacteriales bacterium]
MGNLLSGELSIIGMKGCEDFTRQVDVYLREWRCREGEDRTFIVRSECPRFGTGEAKGLIYETLRGRDVYIISDMFNYGVTFKMYGMTVPM